MLSATGKISMKSIRCALFTQQDLVSLHRAKDDLKVGQIIIDDDFSMTMSRLASRARGIRSKHELGLVIIDYFQLMDDDDIESERAEQKLSLMVRKSKSLSKELSCPIVGISQLNAKGQLYGARSIAHHADGVLIFEEPDEDDKELVPIVFAKMRDGERNVRVKVRFKGEYMRFEDDIYPYENHGKNGERKGQRQSFVQD
jgi:replicative DNA helicase